MAEPIGRRIASWAARARYAATLFSMRPGARVLDAYFRAVPDPYRMVQNGGARFEAINRVIAEHVGACRSILDISCHEGYGLHYLMQRTDAERGIGLDISTVALERARKACAGLNVSLAQFDLTSLYDNPACSLPIEEVCDVVIVSEILIYVGALGFHVWKRPRWRLDRKRAFLKALQRHARKAVIVQHFGVRERDAIGAVLLHCGARLADPEWGIYVLDGTA